MVNNKINLNQLNTNNIPQLVGKSMAVLAQKVYRVLKHSRIPIYLTGASGTGKSILAMNLAKQYALQCNVPAYYVQLSPEQTKTSLILGLRLVQGSLVPVNGIVADCMEQGGIIVVDEATHATQDVLLMFNSILDRTSVTAIGDCIVEAKDTFCVIFCANDSIYSGNTKLPQSFAQRVVGIHCDYPEWEDEVSITNSIVRNELNTDILKEDLFKINDAVIKYLVTLARNIRTDNYPLSVRNVANAVIMLSLVPKNKKSDESDYFRTESAEIKLKGIAEGIFNREIENTIELIADGEVKTATEMFCNYILEIGIETFREVVLNCFMYYLDVDMGFTDIENTKEQLKMRII